MTLRRTAEMVGTRCFADTRTNGEVAPIPVIRRSWTKLLGFDLERPRWNYRWRYRGRARLGKADFDRDLMRTHLLHIGKTGGNALKHALRPYKTSGSLDIVFHPHSVRLSDVPVGESVLFMLRDPVDRFISGFNSRRRRGRPLNNFEWTQDEAAAFTAFPTANDLAEALSVAEDRRRAAAVAAMRGIYHVKSSYADWLVDFDYLGSRRDDISWVGLTSRLADDFERLKQILGLPVECVLPADPVASHRRLDTDETCLSPVGIKNIEGWYAADYPFLTYFAAEAAGGIARGGS